MSMKSRNEKNDKSRKDTWRNNGWQVLKFHRRGKQQIQKSE